MPRGVYPIEKRKGLFPKGHPFFGNKKTQFQKGHKIWLGRKHTEETKRKMKEKAKYRKREKAPNWQGGISFEPYPMDWTEDIREAIRKRDNYVCQMCGIHQDELKGWNKKLDVHHIDYDKDNLNPENLISLCKSCHMKTNCNREYWKIYFYHFNNFRR